MTIFYFLLLLPKYFIFTQQTIKKFALISLLSFILTPILLQAGDTTCNTGDVDHDISLGEQTITGTTLLTNISYEQLYIPSDGNITIIMTKENKATTFYIGTNCGLKDIYDSNASTGTPDTKSNLHEVPRFPVTQGQILYLMYGDDDAKPYTLDINYTAPIIEVSIAPETITIPQGITSVDLDVTLNRGAINGDLNITYTNSHDNSTNYLIIEKWYDEATLTIDINTSDLTQGEEFNITLVSAVDSSGTDTGIITDNNTSTITIGAPMADLYIIKEGSQDTVKLNTSFHYSIAVVNIGSADASDVAVTDTLPSALYGYIDLTATNTASTGWTCEYPQSPPDNTKVVCDYDGNISAGETKIITLHATVPNDTSIIGTIINNVSVHSDPLDYDITNNTAIERTKIVAEDYEEINEVLELCYTDTTETTMDSVGFNKNCEKTGNFWSGNGCTATVDINATAALTHDINITLTKMYAPEIVNGNCSINVDGTETGTCSGFQDINIEGSPSYTKGYVYNIISSDGNFEITDTDSYDGNPNNPADLDGIGLYATYTYEGIYHYGRLSDCSGLGESGIEITSTADAIDPSIGTNVTLAGYYNNSLDTSYTGNPVNHQKYIQTMVAASQRNITGVYLDIETKETESYHFEGTANNYSDFVIIPYLVDSDENGECSKNNIEHLYDSAGDELIINVVEGSYSGTKTMAVPLDIRKNARLQLIIVDPNLLSPEGQKCLSTSSSVGSLEGIGQCGNSEIQYTGGFGVDAWDRCAINNGQPCLSQNGGYSGGGDPTYPGYNPLYDNPLGCYMCTFNIQPACSTDNFAIRPDKFDLGMSHTDAPNLLRAGEDYGISLTAKDAANNIPNTSNGYTNTYTIIDHNFNDDLDTYEIKYFKDGTEDTAGILHGNSDLNRSATVYAVNGLSSFSTSEPSPADEIVQVSYNDVGLIDLFIYDKEWAEVDNDDTPEDCTSSTHTWICGDKNVTFIPHHFSFTELNITNHAGPDSNFTYVADNRGMPISTPPTRSPMAARLHAKIEALTKDGGITQNFRADDASYPYDDSTLYYENPVDINISVVVPSTGTNSYLYPDANESNVANSYIGFGRTGLDDNGTRNVLWDESNFPLEFNFQREINEETNPFNVNGSYIQSITIVSHYVDSNDSDTADISGTRLGDWDNATAIAACATDPGCVQVNADNNATFYYARTRSSKSFYDDNVDPGPVITPISIDVYCDLGFTACDSFGIDTVNGQISDDDWWLSWEHSKSLGDGSITLTATSNGTVSGPPKPNIDASGGADETVEVTHTGTTLPDIVDIDFITDDSAANFTDAWLIHNPDNPWEPSPFYRVRFIGATTGWAGHGDTGHVVGGEANIQKNNRLEW